MYLAHWTLASSGVAELGLRAMFGVSCMVGTHSRSERDHEPKWSLVQRPQEEVGPQIIGRVVLSSRGQKAFLGIKTSMLKNQSPENTEVIRREFICEGCWG